MSGGTCYSTVHGVANSQTWLSDFTSLQNYLYSQRQDLKNRKSQRIHKNYWSWEMNSAKFPGTTRSMHKKRVLFLHSSLNWTWGQKPWYHSIPDLKPGLCQTLFLMRASLEFTMINKNLKILLSKPRFTGLLVPNRERSMSRLYIVTLLI